jgi:hypothetical protein
MHRVEYGKYSETANEGKCAILKITIEGLRADFFNAVEKFFGGKNEYCFI